MLELVIRGWKSYINDSRGEEEMSMFYPELNLDSPLPLLMGLGVGEEVYPNSHAGLLDERVGEATSGCFSAIGNFF